MNPQQQKQFSSWWLDKQYGGDFNNVDGLYQNEVTGVWQGDPNRIFDINPETGQKGQFKYMATPAYTGWIDVTPDVYGEYTNVGNGGRIKMVRNRHGLYSPEESYYAPGNGIVQRYEFTVNPNTGEEGKWVWLGTMGWVNMEGDPQEPPAPGTPTFGNFGDGSIVGPAGSEVDGGGSNDTTSTNQGNSTSSTPTPTGYYWAYLNGDWQWFPVYEGEGYPDGAVYVAGSTAPVGEPAGWTDPSLGGDNNGGSDNGVNPPDSGLFTAGDMLRRDGGPITSPFYDNARQQALASLQEMALANGRTQNTAEEIGMFTGANRPTFSADGLFDPTSFNLMRGLNI